MTPLRVEVKIKKGVKAIPKAVRINGWEIPNTRLVEVRYVSNEARMVRFEVLATDLVEVDEEDW